MKRNASRIALLIALAGIMFVSAGCAASVGEYFVHRYQDFGEVIDLGITVTKTPQIGLYWNSLDLITVGYSDIDGQFIGWGGGQIGMTRVHAKCWALLYGHEEIGWGPLLDDPARREEAIMRRRSNVVGIASSLVGINVNNAHTYYRHPPDYTPACVHFIPHIAYVGLVWNARYPQIVDFALGWFGLDIAGDDGYPTGKWSFPRRARRSGQAFASMPHRYIMSNCDLDCADEDSGLLLAGN